MPCIVSGVRALYSVQLPAPPLHTRISVQLHVFRTLLKRQSTFAVNLEHQFVVLSCVLSSFVSPPGEKTGPQMGDQAANEEAFQCVD